MPIVLNGSGPVTGVTSLNTTVSDTEIGYLDGVTSALQTQIDGKPTGAATSWTSYTPSLTAVTTNPTLGTGSVAEGQYLKIGKLVIAQFFIRFGTSGVAAGSGNYRVSLPSTIKEGLTASQYDYGNGYIFDSSAGQGRLIGTVLTDGNAFVTLAYVAAIDNIFSNVTNAAPWTWAASDEIQGNVMYLEA